MTTNRTWLSFSLRSLALVITLSCVVVGVITNSYEQRYARNKRAHQYFETLDVQMRRGDPIPPGFVYLIDGEGIGDGLPQFKVTPDWLESKLGQKLSYPPIRELSFQASRYQNAHKFTPDMLGRITNLAPQVEAIHFPPIDKIPEFQSPEAISASLSRLRELREIRLVSFYKWPLTDEHFKLLSQSKSLQVITASLKLKVTNKCLDPLVNMPHLQVVSINSPEINSAAAAEFHELRPDIVLRINGEWYGDKMRIYRMRTSAK